MDLLTDKYAHERALCWYIENTNHSHPKALQLYSISAEATKDDETLSAKLICCANLF